MLFICSLNLTSIAATILPVPHLSFNQLNFVNNIIKSIFSIEEDEIEIYIQLRVKFKRR